MQEVTFEDFTHNVRVYLGNNTANSDDVEITRNGIPVLRIIMDTGYKGKSAKSENNDSISRQLLGVAAGLNMSLEEIKAERLAKYERTA
ncbi:MAG: hypothetical protein LBK68_03840 [Candidatus Margulisbacteria bacterium]|jgi:hypothetical protein|nr:hypothetical protein [Candidatus Margulisiibacteriota bacterium]